MAENVAINIEEIAAFLENVVSDDLYMSPNCCIFETPKILSRHNTKAYVPNAFAIGPLHHGQENLKRTEKIKFKYLRGLISRAQNPEKRMREFIGEIMKIEDKVRLCYAGQVTYKREEFVKMLVVDGCFLIELFRKDGGMVHRDQDDPIFNMSCLLQFLYHDLILLENQIPWLVLDCLFDMTSDDNDTKPLVQLAIEFFANMFSSTPSPVDPNQLAESKHILDLLRNWLVAPIIQCKDSLESSEWQTFPSATEIAESGIKFKKLEGATSILDIRFTNGVLEIPNLLIQETTETIFRNLISYEQCSPECSPIITCYAIVLDNLINTTKDVQILCKKETIDSWLNPEDATQFFSKLYLDAYVKKFYYLGLCKEVHKYRQRRWPRWRTAYMHNYFGTAWAIASQIVAAIILILTFLQTLFSIIK
ncbi:hypothetical protein P3X46_032651 [Hevea brasiliensis]|uniref:Uncharacterized protein n=2 Tax=Hevea brasiliensis TaxID=3981 RepID=A0A6A6M1Z9_HEVBR|nr:UPF0481 protein At3g47200 [Hevea brasiliensis]KAF2305959.1 hypothetical protein GH714_009161 [Hevea brasiliensis]KAJ9135470.1 hypothetical protein P3X46_032651 [Hevea brasiliensis]